MGIGIGIARLGIRIDWSDLEISEISKSEESRRGPQYFWEIPSFKISKSEDPRRGPQY